MYAPMIKYAAVCLLIFTKKGSLAMIQSMNNYSNFIQTQIPL